MPATLRSTPARPLSIIGTGHALPARVVASDELDIQLNKSIGSIERISGVRKRHFAATGETAAGLAAIAAQKALDAAGLDVADIDCLIAASGTMDQAMPSNAALVHKEIGLSNYGTPAYDIGASCLSFLAAIDTMSWPIIANHYRNVLIVTSDIASCGLNWEELEASAIFGDGAAAAVIGLAKNTSSSHILASKMRTLSAGSELCRIRAGGSRYHPSRVNGEFSSLAMFEMKGKRVFKLVAAHIPEFLDDLLQSAGIGQDDIDWIVPHQASHLAMLHLTERLGFNPDRVINIFAEHGNQVAASLPTALDIAIRSNRIQRGHRVLLLGTGAGVTLGGMVLEY